MNIIDRYLRAVRFFLPRDKQEDIIHELSEDIRSQIEEREAQRGRPLNEAEREELTRQYGHPALLASRYGPRRQLIGPEIFPIYLLVLKFALLANIVIQVVLSAAFLIGGQGHYAARQMLLVPAVAFLQFGCITLAFAALDRYWPSLAFRDRWSPRNLPTFLEAKRIRRARPLARLVIVVLFTLWWLAALRLPVLIFGPRAPIAFAPVWQRVYWPILLLAVASGVTNGILLIRPAWARLCSAIHVVTTAAGVAVVAYLLRAGDLVVALPATRRALGDGALVAIMNRCIAWTLACAAVVSVVMILVELRQTTGSNSDRSAIRA